MNTVTPRSHILVIIGNIAMLVGAIDPMEGSLIILPGSVLVLLGTYLSNSERCLIIYRLWVFILIAIGVTALLGLSMAGGFGGSSMLSIWWGLLVIPYMIGWVMGICGPDSPRWVLWLGIGIGLWYLTILVMIQEYSAGKSDISGIVIGAIGVLTISGCIYRLRKKKIG